ncbi:MAG: K+/H+ antiporter subunit F, partial [Thiopseudomonas sp.]|nr:K+/H+ antiporter subunit F [Thiopseudomonas sp.]
VLLNSRFFFEAALLIALFGFFSTVVLCKYLLRGDIIE